MGAAGALAAGALAAGALAAGALAAGAGGTGVAVAEEPQARIAANRRTKGPRIRNLGFLNQWFKMDLPSAVGLYGGAPSSSTLA